MSSDRHAAIVDAALDAIVSIDTAGVVIEFNRAAEEIFGYPAEEAIGRGMVDLIVPPDLREAHRRGFERHLTTNTTVVMDQRIEIAAQRRGGEVFPVELTVTRSDHEPQPVFTAWVRDITDRREREDQLRATSARLEALIANLGSGILVEDLERRVALANRELCETFGIPKPPEELVGLDCEAAATEVAALFEDPDGFLARIVEILRAGETVRGEELRMRDGRVFERDFVVAESNGEVLGRLWIYRDVTDRVRAAIELEAMRDAAVEASVTKSRFLAMMSHEIRTPLTGLMGLVDLMRAHDLTGEQRGIVRLMDESAEHMLQMVGDVLDLSKIEAGMMEINPSVFVPRDELQHALSLFAPKAEANGVELIANLDDRLLGQPVCGDVVRVRQVVQNLVSNAVKFTDTGSIMVTGVVRAVDGDVARKELAATVVDTGVGMAQEELQTLFEPFIQGEESRRRQSGGTGLGLAICSRLAKMMGGDISVESAPGAGTEFSFVVPVGDAPEGAAPEKYSGQGAVAAEHNGMRIGVVEDSSINREVISRLVAGLGYEVVTAANGVEALEVIQAEPPLHAILMDCQMPEMDGLEATARIRALPGAKSSTPIIAMTASALAKEREKCMEVGMDDFLTKPLRRRQLESTLMRWARLSANAPVFESPSAEATTTGAATPDQDAVDQRALTDLRKQLGDEAIEAILGTFFVESKERRGAMLDAAAHGDLASVQREAHTLKSASAALGARGMSGACEQLEHSCRATGTIDPGLVQAAADEIGEAIAGLSRMGPGDSAPSVSVDAQLP
ncbi:MAG: PAS domain S-box protein [Thermoleophilia bacterium]|nr:PAS domain S-box protein [Thermoleophilia bacterium]MDH3725189.1 PAS domain S-box protein [Thermoleophilia bacterium]